MCITCLAYVLNEVGPLFGILKYVYDIVVKSSRSLSHLLMGYCISPARQSRYRLHAVPSTWCHRVETVNTPRLPATGREYTCFCRAKTGSVRVASAHDSCRQCHRHPSSVISYIAGQFRWLHRR